MLYHKASYELMEAKKCQSQISIKMYEIKLIDIDSHYAQNHLNRLSNAGHKQTLLLDISNIKNRRNLYLYNAIDSTLELCKIELEGTASFSMAVLSINSLCSFINSQISSELQLPYTLSHKLYQIFFSSSTSSLANPQLTIGLKKLKTACGM